MLPLGGGGPAGWGEGAEGAPLPQGWVSWGVRGSRGGGRSAEAGPQEGGEEGGGTEGSAAPTWEEVSGQG